MSGALPVDLQRVLEREAADKHNMPFARPIDPEAFHTAEDGTQWRILVIDFHAKQSCGDCKDEVTVQLDLAGTTCEPWPTYRQ